jgi:uncharacterized protein (TIGR03437 family)
MPVYAKRLILFLCFCILPAAQAQDRRTVLKGSVHPRARAQFDQGQAEPDLKMGTLILGLTRTAAQQAALEQLLEAQRTPSSPDYHRWLTPEQFANRFGAPPASVQAATRWLESYGLTIDHTARGQNWIGFSGTASQAGAAFRTQIHRYRVNGENHFANATEISIPEPLAAAVSSVVGLNDFGPKPQYTASNGTHALAPGDIALMYHLQGLYNQGINGTGQSIAIAGVSDLEKDFADIRQFRSTFKLPASDPTVVLYGQDPGLNSAVIEADADIEWSGATAPAANIIYVNSTSPFASATYAVDQNFAPVINLSFGFCEPENYALALLTQAIVQQANSQGITFVASSGDAGAAGCDAWFHEPIATNGLAVALPASVPEVTAVGGTEFNEGTVQVYWNPANAADGSSAITYIPEVAWNDSLSSKVISASGGGASIFFPKPIWQTGPGVPADGSRDVPDVSMPASAAHDGYRLCSLNSCLTVGGTSLASPVFAGMLALVNQSLISRGFLTQPGLGNINPMLYRLGQGAGNVFHDITDGDNKVPCLIGTPACTSGSFGYSAGPGYDQVTGLGSVDASNLVNGWIQGGVALITAQPSSTSITMNQSVQIVVTLTALGGNLIPGGTVTANLANTATPLSSAPGALPLGSATLSASGRSSSATLTIAGSQLTPGTNAVTITYGGDTQFNQSNATVTISVTVPSTNSVVVPSAFPQYFNFREPPIPFNPGVSQNGWPWVIQLTEVAGVATTLTSFVVNGQDLSSSIKSFFGTNLLPAHGTLTAGLSSNPASVPGTEIVKFAGQDASGFQWDTQLPVQFVGGPQQIVYIYNGGLVNAASGQGAYAPGMLLSVFGNDFTATPRTTGTALSIPLPFALAGSSARIDNVPAPYYYAGAGQINIQIPYETAPGTAVLTVTGFAGQTFNYSFTVQPAAPGIFMGPTGFATPNPSGGAGQEFILFITGEGQVTPPLATGATPSPDTPVQNLPHPVLPVTMTIGNVPATIDFVGIPSGLAGVTQVNFTVPPNAPLGVQPLVVTVGGVSSLPASFKVTSGQ